MANHKSALKRMRQNEKRNTRNRALRSSLRTAIKKYRALLEGKELETAAADFPKIQKVLDKAVTKGILHPSNAARKKSRLAAALRRAQAA
jgi:small subunit ribosomal protein S20